MARQRPTKTATKPAAHPADLEQASNDETAAQAQRLENARLALAEVVAAVLDAYALIVGLPADADQDQVDEAMAAEKLAREKVDMAVQGAREAFGVPVGERLPEVLAKELTVLDALSSTADDEIPAGSHVSGQDQSGAAAPATVSPGVGLDGGNTAGTTETAPKPDAVASASGTHNPESDDRQEGGAGNSAGPAEAPSIEDRDDLLMADVARAEFQWQIEKGLRLAEENAQEGLVFLQQRRTEVTLMAELTVEFAAQLDQVIASISVPRVSGVSGVVTVAASVDSRWRLGREFTREAITFEPGELSADDLAVLRADPVLSVQVTE